MESVNNNYFSIAVDDLKYLLNTYRAYPNYRQACILCQQTVEKILKYFIIKSDDVKDKDSLRAHNLRKLYKECIRNYPEFKEVENKIIAMNGYYFETKHPGFEFFTPSKEEASDAIITSIACYKIACTLIEDIDSVDVIEEEIIKLFENGTEDME